MWTLARAAHGAAMSLSTEASALRSHHRIALFLAVPLSGSILVDSIHRVSTGRATAVTDDALDPFLLAAGVHLLLAAEFVALYLVLRNERPRFADLGPVARTCCRFLSFGTFALAVSMAVGVMWVGSEAPQGPTYDATGLAAALGLGGTLLAALVLGLTQVRRNRLGVGGRVLGLLVPVGALTAALAVIDENFGSPVLLTATLLVGLSLLGVGVHAGSPSRQSALPRI